MYRIFPLEKDKQTDSTLSTLFPFPLLEVTLQYTSRKKQTNGNNDQQKENIPQPSENASPTKRKQPPNEEEDERVVTSSKVNSSSSSSSSNNSKSSFPSGLQVINPFWIIDSISNYKLLPLEDYFSRK